MAQLFIVTMTPVELLVHEIYGSYLTSDLLSPFHNWVASCEMGPRWVPKNFIDNKSTLVQVIVWFRQTRDDKYMV